MTLEELIQKLYDFNVPERWYSLDEGLKPMAHILYKNYSKWEYFYMDERGGRNDLRIFFNEQAAFDYLWERMEYDLQIFKIKPRSEHNNI